MTKNIRRGRPIQRTLPQSRVKVEPVQESKDRWMVEFTKDELVTIRQMVSSGRFVGLGFEDLLERMEAVAAKDLPKRARCYECPKTWPPSMDHYKEISKHLQREHRYGNVGKEDTADTNAWDIIHRAY